MGLPHSSERINHRCPSQRLYLLSKLPQDDYAKPADTSNPDNFVVLQFTDQGVTKVEQLVALRNE
jgi:hypothetical protein